MPAKITQEEATMEVAKVNHTLLGEYKSHKDQVKVKCNLCDTERNPSPRYGNLINNKSKCGPCTKKSKKKSSKPKYTEESVKLFLDQHGDTLDSPFMAYNGKISIKCGKCKEQYKSSFARFKDKGHRCGCKNNHKRERFTYDKVKNIYSANGDELLEKKYKNNSTKMKFMCGNCKQIREKTFFYYYKCGNRCEQCYSKTKYTQQEIEQLIAEGGDTCVGEFNTVNHPIAVQCNTTNCGQVYHIEPHHYFEGRRCGACKPWRVAQQNKLKYADIKDFIESFEEVLVSTEYHGYDGPLDIQCHNCNKTYQKSYQQFYQGGRCNICNDHRSRGEKELHRILEKYKILHTPQKRFDECRNINTLPFDEYLTELNICIEYQGEQHSRPIKAFGGEIRFKQQQLHDKIKSDFCTSMNIPLLAISYKDLNRIESIIIEYLKLKKID